MNVLNKDSNWNAETETCKSKYYIRPYSEDANSNELNPLYHND